jgi:hypothetical protein
MSQVASAGRCSVARFHLSLLESWRSRESSHDRALRWLRKAANQAEVGQLRDETAYLSSDTAKNQPKRCVQSLGELSTISNGCTMSQVASTLVVCITHLIRLRDLDNFLFL